MSAIHPAFWILVWVFAVQHPGGSVTEREWDFQNHMPFMECDAKARAMRHATPEGKALTEDGGKAIYSRFVCVPVAP